MVFVIFFFFSSRRRHTRLQGDWSSDVCSSDLQLVVNLGANAIRFTPRGGRVVVRLIDTGPELELQVEDTGVGIPADALPHIFEAYRQAHSERGGTEIGRASCRERV